MKRCAIGFVMLAGCDWVFGLGNPKLPIDSAPRGPDAPHASDSLPPGSPMHIQTACSSAAAFTAIKPLTIDLPSTQNSLLFATTTYLGSGSAVGPVTFTAEAASGVVPTEFTSLYVLQWERVTQIDQWVDAPAGLTMITATAPANADGPGAFCVSEYASAVVNAGSLSFDSGIGTVPDPVSVIGVTESPSTPDLVHVVVVQGGSGTPQVELSNATVLTATGEPQMLPFDTTDTITASEPIATIPNPADPTVHWGVVAYVIE